MQRHRRAVAVGVTYASSWSYPARFLPTVTAACSTPSRPRSTCFDFGEFDPEAPDLDLGVQAPPEFQRPVRSRRTMSPVRYIRDPSRANGSATKRSALRPGWSR